jgi:hypothetical protein
MIAGPNNQMTDKKGWGSAVLGWFVVQDKPEGTAGSGNDADYTPFADASEEKKAIRKAAAEKPIEVFATPPPAPKGGTVDFESVFNAAGIDAEEQGRVSKTLELLNSLPPGTDDAVKKQIVMASLKAFAVPIEKIIEAGAQELQALEAYIRSGASDTETLSTEADQRIKQYEEEIVRLRTVMQQRVEEQAAAVRSCNSRKLEVQKVLEFFGQEAVAKVVRDSPKLHEPGKPA